MLKEQQLQLIILINKIIKKIFNINIDNIILEKPKTSKYGDISTNIAMQLTKICRLNAFSIATEIVNEIYENIHLISFIEKIEIANPGFINFYLSHQARISVIEEIERLGDKYGSLPKHGNKILFEFVSANPTGPLHVGHARQAAIGDVLCNLYESIGWDVTREFYYNDAGNQIDNLVSSVIACANSIYPGSKEYPENGYNGEYIKDIANNFMMGLSVINNKGEEIRSNRNIQDVSTIKNYAINYLRNEQDTDLKLFNIKFDNYYLESSLYTEGLVEKAVNIIINNGYTYKADGALWLKTTSLNTGDDKDRVMRKKSGDYTYFVPDIAYHKTKWDRGFKKAINIQGSDHHGTIARVRAGLQALEKGIPPDYPIYVLHKMVKIIKEGKEVKLSKRAGSYVTMNDLIKWVGKDAARYFLIQRKSDTEFIFDIDLALSKNEENPVFYIQYAHARICSILKKVDVNVNQNLLKADLGLLTSSNEVLLLNILSEFPHIIEKSAKELAPHHIAFWLRECASKYHNWYNSEKIITDNQEITLARLRLAKATKQVLVNGLKIIGVSAPENM